MALSIRLARGGAKKRPFYRIVVADARSPRDGRFIEKLGTYNPMLAGEHPEARRARRRSASSTGSAVGAQPSDRVARFLGNAGMIADAEVQRERRRSRAPKAKAQERAKAEADAAAKAAEAAGAS